MTDYPIVAEGAYKNEGSEQRDQRPDTRAAREINNRPAVEGFRLQRPERRSILRARETRRPNQKANSSSMSEIKICNFHGQFRMLCNLLQGIPTNDRFVYQ